MWNSFTTQPPGTPQHNGVSERHNHTLLDMVRSMTSLTDLPILFWGYALKTAVFMFKRAPSKSPSKSVETTQYELWFGEKPKLLFLKVWDCDAYVKKFQHDKLKPKSEKCVFIGYPKENVGYTFLSQIRRQDIRCWEWILSREGVSHERSEWEESRKLDKVIVPSPLLESSSSQKSVPVTTTPISEEAKDDDHVTSDHVTTDTS